MKVSLIATVKDAGPHLVDFLDSVRAQSRPPDEIVIVDGGSTDGTWQILRDAPGVLALSETGANIARGRNLAVRAATHDVIAVTDADCVLESDWLARILEPIQAGADVAAGFYRPLGDSLLQVAAAASIPEANEVKPGWMPSSRSLALRRDVLESIGGYPEWLEVGEDMYLNHRLVETGARVELAPGAVVWWRIRPTLATTWRQYARYAEGDALGGMYPQRHALRFGVYGFAVYAALSGRGWARALAVLGGLAYAARPTRRAVRRVADPRRRRAVVAATPPTMAFIDLAKMWGYARGLLRAGRRP